MLLCGLHTSSNCGETGRRDLSAFRVMYIVLLLLLLLVKLSLSRTLSILKDHLLLLLVRLNNLLRVLLLLLLLMIVGILSCFHLILGKLLLLVLVDSSIASLLARCHGILGCDILTLLNCTHRMPSGINALLFDHIRLSRGGDFLPAKLRSSAGGCHVVNVVFAVVLNSKMAL